jgi:hypothetical protein
MDAEELGAQRASVRGTRTICEGKVPNQRSTHGFKGGRRDSSPLTPGLPCQRDFRPRACAPRRNNRPLARRLGPAGCGLAESARSSHEGALTSVTLAEMPAPVTAPMFTTTAITAPTKCPQAATATITHKSSRVSLQLTHELGGYMWQMRSRAPSENMKNTTNTKIIRLSLSTTP